MSEWHEIGQSGNHGRSVTAYMLPGIIEVIGSGTTNFAGLHDDGNVLKSQIVEGESAKEFEVEAAFYEALGKHPRIIGYFGQTRHGIKLERESRLTEHLERVRYCLLHPDYTTSIQSDNFALGSTIFRTMNGRDSCQDIADDVVIAKYERLEFHATDFVRGTQVRKCWQQKYSYVDEVISELAGTRSDCT